MPNTITINNDGSVSVAWKNGPTFSAYVENQDGHMPDQIAASLRRIFDAMAAYGAGQIHIEDDSPFRQFTHVRKGVDLEAGDIGFVASADDAFSVFASEQLYIDHQGKILADQEAAAILASEQEASFGAAQP